MRMEETAFPCQHQSIPLTKLKDFLQKIYESYQRVTHQDGKERLLGPIMTAGQSRYGH